MSSDKQLENLMPPWEPGQSGNPAGKPRTPPELKIKTLKNNYDYKMFLQKVLSEPLSEIKPSGKYSNQAKNGTISSVEGLALKLIQMGLSGKIQHMTLLLNQIGVNTVGDKTKSIAESIDSSEEPRPLKRYSSKTLRLLKETIEKDPVNAKD